MSGRLAGRAAVVTGASSGVGRAVVLALAAEGVRVHGIGRDPDRLRQLGERVETHVVDLRRRHEIEAFAQAIGDVDTVVHCAGTIAMASVDDTTGDDLRDQLLTNVEGPFNLTRAVLPRLRRSGGDVVFVNSSAGLRANAGAVAYAASKGALRSLADGLRDEVNADGIRVLSLFLGRTATPMQEAVHAGEGRRYDPDSMIQPDDVAELVVTALALPRTAEVTELSVRPARKPTA
jgi:NADP-dependent 3-hydroxy acid dehydrogenase YdfG